MAETVKKLTRSKAKTLPNPREHKRFMRSYTTDGEGNKVLIGLTLKETVEYEEYRDAFGAERKTSAMVNLHVAEGRKAQGRFQQLHRKHEAARLKAGAARP